MPPRSATVILPRKRDGEKSKKSRHQMTSVTAPWEPCLSVQLHRYLTCSSVLSSGNDSRGISLSVKIDFGPPAQAQVPDWRSPRQKTRKRETRKRENEKRSADQNRLQYNGRKNGRPSFPFLPYSHLSFSEVVMVQSGEAKRRDPRHHTTPHHTLTWVPEVDTVLGRVGGHHPERRPP